MSTPVSFAEVINLWKSNAGFRTYFIDLLTSSPFPVFRWESPPVTAQTINQSFEFVLLDSPEIELEPDPSDFAEYFVDCDQSGIVEFPNLGNDAILIAPYPDNLISDYGHLASFLRNAPEPQQHFLWERVGTAMQRRISSKPVWLNTAGGGVAWLHVRLDDRPKYYGYSPYRKTD